MPRFTTPPAREAFDEEVWEMVRRVPRGRVTTYGRIAELVGPPGGMEPAAYRAFGARWVGGAMARCPDGVPWWRVINAQGKVSGRDGAARQVRLLEAEGIVFDDRGRTDLDLRGWPDGDI